MLPSSLPFQIGTLAVPLTQYIQESYTIFRHFFTIMLLYYVPWRECLSSDYQDSLFNRVSLSTSLLLAGLWHTIVLSSHCTLALCHYSLARVRSVTILTQMFLTQSHYTVPGKDRDDDTRIHAVWRTISVVLDTVSSIGFVRFLNEADRLLIAEQKHQNVWY